jgi:SHS2 domain-containing protein
MGAKKGGLQQKRPARPPARPARPPPAEYPDDRPEGPPDDGPLELQDEGGEAEAERPSYSPRSEEGRHIMELLEKHQEYAEERPSRRPHPQPAKRFEVVEHTADVGIKAYGDTINEAFENAALGMFNIITDPSKIGLQQDFEVMIEGEDLKTLLHEWLSQLLILSQVNGMLFGGFRVEMKPVQYGLGLTGWAIGEPADPRKHVYKTEIKAVTHHMLEVRERPPMVKVLFDI